MVLYDAVYEQERIGIVTLNHPEKRNALSTEMLRQLGTVLRQVAAQGRVNAVILRGAGTVFSSGHDLREIQAGGTPEMLELFTVAEDTFGAIRTMPQIVIAEVQGIATAAGCQLVAAADLAVASSAAKFATPGVRNGFFCTTPGVFVSRAVPQKKAAEMLFTGEYLSAVDAERFGLVNRVAEPSNLSDETVRLARQVAQWSPTVLAEGKKAFYRQLGMEESQALAYASQVMVMEAGLPDAREGIAAFLEKRPPHWSDRA
jgi:enoyl-CoA hydratase/carnithine racemase